MGRLFAVVLLVSIPVAAQSVTPSSITPPPPQSARQALLEMVFGKGENDFQKHLPEDARQALIHKGETPETSDILKVATIGRELTKGGGQIETFETGSILLASNLNEHEKVEVDVERDGLIGEADEIELSIHYFKNGEPQALPVVPSLTFTFKQEKEIWRLTELTAAAHFPLTDPDYLKGLRKQQDEETESQAKKRINVIAGAESGYMGRHPDLGYSCSLQTLFAPDPGEDPNNQVFDPGQGTDLWYGYRVTLSGCDGNPPSKFKITATPADPDAKLKTFCSDETGNLKFLPAGKTSNCFSRGKAVAAENEATE